MVHDFLTSNTQHLKASLVSLSCQLLLQLFSAHGASCYSRKKKYFKESINWFFSLSVNLRVRFVRL